jgi:hypothetical protein
MHESCYMFHRKIAIFRETLVQRNIKLRIRFNFFFLWRSSPTRARAASLLRFLDHI